MINTRTNHLLQFSWYCLPSVNKLVRVILLLVLKSVGIVLSGYGQCPIVDFSIPNQVCKESSFSPITGVSNAQSFEWDACDGAVFNDPVSVNSSLNANLKNVYDVGHFFDGSQHFAFIVDYGDGSGGSDKILRYNFGSDLKNSPTITNLGSFGVISRPLGIGVWKDASTYFALVSTESVGLFLLNFGSALANDPSVTQIVGLSGVNDHRQIEIIKEDGNVLAIIAGGGTQSVTILNFGSSITNQPVKSSISIPNSQIVTSLDVAINCNSKDILVSSFGSGVFVLQMGSSFLNTSPSISQPQGLTSGFMLGLSVERSMGNYVCVVSNQPAGIIRINFGQSFSNTTPDIDLLGVFNGVNFAIGHTLAKAQSTIYSMAVNLTGQLSILEFPKNCSIPGNFKDNATPDFTYSEPGDYTITLSGTTEDGLVVTKSKIVTVISPDQFEIDFIGNCVDQTVSFSARQTNGLSLSNATWSFGDASTGSGLNTTHQFASAGSYNVTLTGTAANGCLNTVTRDIPIFSPPEASFNIPTGLVCTNSQLLLTNTTLDNFQGYLTYQWLVNNLQVSTSRNLTYSFNQPGANEVRMIASIPGCSDESRQTLNDVQPGPAVDFAIGSQCENQITTFSNLSSGSITGYQWNLGNGQTTTTTNTSQSYSPGNYTVSLQATAPNGCINTTSKLLTIYSQPQPNFSLELPPFSCAGTPSQFNDLTPAPTDSNISSWLWNFGVGGASSSNRNPTYIYTAPGEYDVSLTTTSNFGCTASMQKRVTIAPSPSADFSSAPACINQGTAFQATGTNIKSWQWAIQNSTYSLANLTHVFRSAGTYDATLNVIGTNDCLANTTRAIVVPPQPTLDFTSSDRCAGQPATFEDASAVLTADPATAWNWNATQQAQATGKKINYTFTTSGSYAVTMTSTHQSGCQYSITKTVAIAPVPNAFFTLSPSWGVPPLSVQFTNQSTGASTYLWRFNDATQSTSTAVSPSFQFTALGDYVIDLIATNAQGCSDSYSDKVSLVIPVRDLSLEKVEIVQDQNSAANRLLLTIKNLGNFPLTAINADVSIAGLTAIRETLNTPLAPGATVTQLLSSQILTGNVSLDYLCVELDGTDDKDLLNNKQCESFTDQTVVFAPYPNPTADFVRFDWIAPIAETVNFLIYNRSGQLVYNKSVLPSEAGLNQVVLDLRALEPGLYYLKVVSPGFNATRSFAIVR